MRGFGVVCRLGCWLTAFGLGLTMPLAGWAGGGLSPAADAGAGADTSASSFKTPELKYEKFVLPNGLVVLTHEDHRLPLVAVDVWYHVAPLNEKVGKTGFAHLFEHMMFEGSEHISDKDFNKYTESIGATDINGTTDFDRTNYFETMPANQLETGLWLESDRMGFLLEGLDRVKLTNQRDVVRNERRQGEGSPYELAGEELYHLLFPKGHPYYGSVIGSHADIEAARVNDIRDFYKQFYTPNNASLAIAGDFDPKQLRALIDKYFGAIPMGPKVEPVTVENTPTPPVTEQKRATVTDTVKLDQITFGFLTPPAFTAEDANGDLLANILCQSQASRLDTELVLKRQVAQSVRCYLRSEKLTSVMQVSITAKPGVKLAELETAFWAEVGKLAKDGPAQAEVDAARTTMLTQKISGLQRLGGFGGVADTMDRYFQYTGDAGYLSKDVAAYQGATVASVKAFAAQYLKQNQAVVVECVPGKKVVDDVPRSPENTDADVKLTAPYTAKFEAAQKWRMEPPKAGPELAFHLPVPKTFNLKNGLTVYLVHDGNLPVVSATLVTRAGGETNPTDKPGIADFTAAMLTEGTAKRSAEKVAADAVAMGTRLAVASSMDGTNAGVTVLTDHADGAMELLSDVVLHPAFNAPDLERIRKKRMLAIEQESDSVEAMAQRVGLKLLYGDTPYGFTPAGTVASVKGFTREELEGFWAGHYGPGDAALVMAGDLTEAQAKTLAEKYFGGWSGSAKGEVVVPAAPADPALRVVLVDKPGSPQTALSAYGLGIPQRAPDMHAVEIMDWTLGASFGSRINMNLREVHGYTYGALARYALYREGGPFWADSLVRTDVTAAAAKELMGELRRIGTEPPTAEELRQAQLARVEAIPARFETTGATAAAVSSIYLYGLPLNYFAMLPDAYRAVTPADVEKAAKTEVRPEHMLFIAVGDKGKIEAGMKEFAAGVGAPVEYADPLGNLLK